MSHVTTDLRVLLAEITVSTIFALSVRLTLVYFMPVMISGTSTCHMLLSDEQVFVDGVWGPYYGAMVPGMWLLEGGQSATGKLIDHVIGTHPAAATLNVPDGT